MTDFAMIKGNDSWLRVAHDNTSLDQQNEYVQLAWRLPGSAEAKPFLPDKAGLAVDPWCRVYRVCPESASVTRCLWQDRLTIEKSTPLFTQLPDDFGDFQSLEVVRPMVTPGPLVISASGDLYIADLATHQVHIFDLMEKRKRRTLSFEQKPCDLACHQQSVFILLHSESLQQTCVYKSNGSDTPEKVPIDIAPEQTNDTPHALAVNQNGRVFILFNAGTEEAYIWAADGQNDRLNVPFAGDLLFLNEQVLVVARGQNDDFLRYYIKPGNHAVMPSMQARLYNGKGIGLGPDGQVIYGSKKGVLSAAQVRPKFITKGRLVCFRLDNQHLQRRWGRVFIDACIPEGTQIKLGFIVTDELTTGPTLYSSAPANMAEFDLPRPDLSPPLPALHDISQVKVDFSLHRRSQNRELPWSFTQEPWRTYEAPVNARAGRYLWLVIDLLGKSSVTPKISQIRVEYPGRDLLRHLPRVFAQSANGSDFLERYLSLLNSNFDELSKRAANREVLVNPAATPEAALPWLSSLLGMELDWRWDEQVKRDILKEAMWLFQRRGTLKGLKRFIEIYLKRDVQIIEHFRTRGLGGAFVGDSQELASSAILGTGFRIGGKLDDTQEVLLNDEEEGTSITDAFTLHGHKFTVLVPIILTEEQQAVVTRIVELHRPAHTVFEICAVESGMRLGSGLHLGLTSVVGLGSGFGQLQLGNSALGRTDLLGQASAGMNSDTSRVGKNSRLGG